MGKADDYTVGYGKPPRGSRFRKGLSGNPNGRPKGRRNLATVIEQELQQEVVINENGNRRTITKLEAAAKQLVNKAATGDMHALKLLHQLQQSAEEMALVTSTANSDEALPENDTKVLGEILKRFGTVQIKDGKQ